jgi:uncharacterized protein
MEMLMRKILLVLLVVCLSVPVFAQQSVAEAAAQARNADRALPADAPTRDQVMTLLDLMQARKTIIAVMDNMKQIMRQAAEKTFREKVPNPTPKQLEALNGIYDDITDIPVDEMINAIIPIYQRHLTKTDLEDLIRFYGSPVAQKMLREQPQILQESMQAGVAVQQNRMDEIKMKVAARVQALTDASDESGTTPKK